MILAPLQGCWSRLCSLALWAMRTHSDSVKHPHVPCALHTAESRPTLFPLGDCSPPGSSDLGVLRARMLEWVAVPFSKVLFYTLSTAYMYRMRDSDPCRAHTWLRYRRKEVSENSARAKGKVLKRNAANVLGGKKLHTSLLCQRSALGTSLYSRSQEKHHPSVKFKWEPQGFLQHQC